MSVHAESLECTEITHTEGKEKGKTCLALERFFKDDLSLHLTSEAVSCCLSKSGDQSCLPSDFGVTGESQDHLFETIQS